MSDTPEARRGGAGGRRRIAPRGTPHTYWNPRPDPLRYVLVMTPQVSRMIEALHGLAQPDERAVAALFAEHGSEYLGWPS